jgi:hypothetical protein
MSDDHAHDYAEQLRAETTGALAPPPARPDPEAGQVVSMLAHAKDPSLPEKQGVADTTAVAEAAGKQRVGVAWVRPMDLLAAQAASWSGRGIDLGASLNQRTRGGTAKAAKATGRGVRQAAVALSERAKKLPPASAFGRRGGNHEMTPVSRRGIARIR